MKRMIKQWMAGLLAAVLVLALLPATARAEEPSEYDVSAATVEITGDGSYTVTGATSDNTIIVTGGTVTLTLNSVSVHSGAGTPLDIQGGDVTLILPAGTKSTFETDPGSGKAGIHVAEDASLTIEGPGALDATGSSNGAGIGGDFTSNAGSITINGGTITAKSTADGAGIGGGHANESQGRIYGQFRSITITGGTVTAESWSNGAGIGCGCWAGAMGPITISGGEVHASTFANSGQACDIGYAHRATDFESTVTVSGGVVYTEGTHGRGIVAKNVDLNNCLIVTRSGDYNFYGDLTFSSDFTLAAGKELPIPGGHALRVSEGAVFTNLGTICINPGGSLDVQGSLDNTSGIITNFSGTVTGGDKITGNPPIELGDVTYLDWDDSAKKLVQRTLHGPYNMVNSYTTDWDSGWYVLTDNVTMPSSIKVNAYDVHLILMDGCTLTTPGIYLENRSDLTIYAQSTGNNMGAISSTAVETYAGIGGRENGYTITINGGKITATGSQGGAGIGGEYGASMGTAVINSGIVTATGGRDEALEVGGAGIGAGFNGRLGGTVTINGGIVIATGCEYSPGIGGAGTNASWQKPADGGNITITGGTVTATGGGGAPGIGGGQYTRDDSLGGSGTFSTGPDGNAVIYASSIQDQSSNSGWSGVIFENNVGQVYGNPIPTENFEVKDGATLTVPVDATLTVSNGITMTNSGTVINNGHVYKTSGGIITGNPFLPTSEEIPFLGSGTADSPYLIPDKTTLEAFRDYINASTDGGSGKYFKLTNNIDLDGSEDDQWTPIGNSDTTAFRGNFDGGGYSITGLYCNASVDSLGLFSVINSSGIVSHLHVEGSVTGTEVVGGIAGNNYGTITDCAFSGTVSGDRYIGGIAGINRGTISDCDFSGTVGSNNNSGGIAGQNIGAITLCHNSADVSSNVNSGGIAGQNIGLIEDCYNTGRIKSNQYAGGISAFTCFMVEESRVSNCYNAGSVEGNISGGIVALNTDAVVTNCYYLESTAASGIGDGDGEATEKSFTQFASGEVAWLLQKGQDEQMWGQTVGTGYPELTDNTEKKVCKVTFHTESQAEYAVKYANYNGKVELPAKPEITGMAFDHWSRDNSISGGKFDETTLVTGDITVYAVGQNTFGGESGDITLTTYGTAMTEDLSEHMAYQLGAETAGKFAYEITAGNDVLNATIEGDILTIPGTANAESYTLTIVAAEKEPAYSLMSVASYGTADVTLTVKVTIEKAASTATPPTAEKLTYNGTAQELVEAGTATGGEMRYSLDGDAYSADIPTGTDAKTYTVWYKVVGDANHNDTDPGQVTVTIAQAAATVTAPTAKMPLTYNGAAQELITAGNVTSDVPGCGTMRYSLEAGSGFSAEIPMGEDAKEYTVYWKVDGADETNYHYNGETSGELTVTIDKAAATVTAPTAEKLTYTGAAQELVEAGSATGGEMQYSFDGAAYSAAIPTGTDAGAYTVWYKVTGDANHNDAAPQSVPVTIAKATAQVTTLPTPASAIYTGEKVALVAAGESNFGALVYSLNEAGPFTGEIPTATEAGTYTVYYMVEGTENWNASPVGHVQAEIKKAASSATVTGNAGLVYSGAPQPLVTSGASETGTVVYALGENAETQPESGAFTETIPTGADAGTYYVWWKILGDVDHGDSEPACVPVTIAKADPVVAAPTPKTLTYTGAAQELVEAGKTTGGTIQYSLDGAAYSAAIPTGVGAGAYTVWYQVAGDANHNDAAPQSVPVTIEKAEGSGNVTMEDYLCGQTDVDPVAQSDTNGAENVTYAYAARGADDYRDTKPTTAGEYTVKALFPATDNYNAVTATADFKITHRLPSDLEEDAAFTCDCASELRLKEEELAQVPPGLSGLYGDVETLTRALADQVAAGTNYAVYDVKLEVKEGAGAWHDAPEDSVPASGLTVTLPYPAGTNARYTFTAVHMFASGPRAGETETPAVTNTDQGITFTVTGLSPVCIGWTAPASSSSSSRRGNYSVTLPAGSAGGAMTADSASAGRGSEVTLTVTPEAGYHLAALAVTDRSGETVALTDNGDGTYTFSMPASPVAVEAEFTACGSARFADLDAAAWYHDYTDYVIARGLMQGVDAATFAPGQSTTRAMVVTILWRLAGEPGAPRNIAFADVAPGLWYTDAISWAAANGIVEGYSQDAFGPDDPITREQLAVMLWRYAAAQGQDVSVGEDTNLLSYQDADQIGDWAFSGLQWAAGSGVLQGTGSGATLSPKATATRAELATVLARYVGQK